jgi:hypothetical protein
MTAKISEEGGAWTHWTGGPQPFETKGRVVAVRFAGGTTATMQADKAAWENIGHPSDIEEYRVLVGPEAPASNMKPTNPKDAIGIRKVNLSCVPAGVMLETAVALMEGAAKYGRHNYRGVGVRASVYYDAAAGHLMDWWEGDDIDADSGLSHVTKAIASLVVLRDAMLQEKLTDDRPPRSKVFKRDFNGKAAEVLDRHADKSPKHWTILD